jgi:hypothetical protein
MSKGLLELVGEIAAMLDELDIPYALGGSLASSAVGEPRATVDVDVAIDLPADAAEALLERAAADYYVPVDSARDAIRSRSSFNLLDTANGLKIDLFVLGRGLLDRMQIERRMRLTIAGMDREIWVTAPEDQILRKLEWYRSTGHVSERQWRDVVAIVRVQGDALDREYLRATARALGLQGLLDEATAAAGDA